MNNTIKCLGALLLLLCTQALSAAQDSQKLVAAMLANTPIIDDLRQLTDEIGGRITGSEANKKAVAWAVEKFEHAGISVKKETFSMPRAWLEHNTAASVYSEHIHFSPKIAAMPFTHASTKSGLTAKIVNLNKGTKADFSKNTNLKGKWLLVETKVLDDPAGIGGLFQEYIDAVAIEERATLAGATGLIYMSSRPKNLLYRHLPSQGANNNLPIMVMERESAKKTQRLLAAGHTLSLNAQLDISKEQAYSAENVIGEIKGSEFPNEIVLIGAHIDSFDMGTGALDNGSNTVMVIDIARQIKKLGLKPKRTIRFALFNGEEQGIYGSFGYTKKHLNELNNHVISATVDMGTGRIQGFFTNGRTDMIPALDQVLAPVAGLGPYHHVNMPVVGTDNYDFMMQGVANLVANQTNANYASNYHAQSDTFDKVDQKQLKLNSAIMAATMLGFANLESITWQRHTSEQVVEMVNKHNMELSMKTFGLWQSWQANQRGIRH